MPGQFLSPDDPEFELAKDARQVCKTGGLPFLLSVLAPLNARVGIPFSVAAYGNADGIETLFVIIPQLSPSSFRR